MIHETRQLNSGQTAYLKSEHVRGGVYKIVFSTNPGNEVVAPVDGQVFDQTHVCPLFLPTEGFDAFCDTLNAGRYPAWMEQK